MAQNLSVHYSTSGHQQIANTKDLIILRALRIIGAIGQGETIAQNSTAAQEALEALNDLISEWQADGMPLWCIRDYRIRTDTAIANYVIPEGPLKIINAFRRDGSNNDTPLLIITREEFWRLSPKTSSGTVNQIYYEPPGGINQPGVLNLFPTPDATFSAGYLIYITGHRPFEVFDNSADAPDFPTYWHNAIKWGLADQLAYEYGVGVTERAQISKKALYHKEQALSFGTEEGSLLLRPTPHWTRDDG